MNDNEKEVQNQGQEHNPGGPCCGPAPWAGWCPGIDNSDSGHLGSGDMPHMMARCFSGCRYFLLFAAILGIIFVVLGYYLAPGVVGICWMIPVAMMAVMALFGILAMRHMTMSNGFSGCCGTSPRRHA
jgi:hypothetical protein